LGEKEEVTFGEEVKGSIGRKAAKMLQVSCSPENCPHEEVCINGFLNADDLLTL
jgi:hypothetical protein